MNDKRMTRCSRPDARRRGFTMAEMVVAVSIMVIVTAVVAGLFVQVRKMISLTQWNAETRSQLRTAVSTIAQDLENIDDRAYFMMLNRDYGTYNPAVAPAFGTPAYGSQAYPGPAGTDLGSAQKRLPADRIAFMTKGPFNTPQNLRVNTPVATSARVYYGHSLWTHDVADSWWRALPAYTLSDANLVSPLLTPPWPADFRNRPALNWELVRQGVLHVQDVTLDPAGVDPALCGPGPTLNTGRLDNDYEYRMVHNDLNAYAPEDLTRWLGTQLSVPNRIDWAALLWAPRTRQYLSGATGSTLDPVVAPTRLLVPHTARVRFQVRLSDGTIVPKTYDDPTDDRAWLRGGLLDIATPRAADGTIAITGMKPGQNFNTVAAPQTNSPYGFGTTQKSPYDVNTAAPIPMLQFAYVWTPNGSNLNQTPATPVLYPVALRVRVEVYDSEKRTPDPIRIDEWLPIRWQR